MKSKKVWTIGILAGLLGAVAVTFFLLRHPERPELELLELLPPDLDLYAVADIQSLGRNPLILKLLSDPPGFPRDAEYERFIRATGFRYENDLKRLALAKSGPDWVGAARVSVDRPRIIHYLESQGAEKKDALGNTVFTFGRSRPLRLVFLDLSRRAVDDNPKGALVAFTVGGDADQVRQAVERHDGRLNASAASEIKRERHLTHFAPGSKIWLVARPAKLWTDGRESSVGSPSQSRDSHGPATRRRDGGEARIGSLELDGSFFRGSKMLYVSLESGPAELYFRVENYCDSPATAERIAGSLEGLLALLQAVPANKAAPSDKTKAASTNIKSLLAGVSVEQVKESVFLRWQWDESALRAVMSDK